MAENMDEKATSSRLATLPQLAMAPQLAPPGKFDFSNTKEWQRWIKRFEQDSIGAGQAITGVSCRWR
ncbi:hypothetical protein ABVT39_027763 [Epinephelus coioides]